MPSRTRVPSDFQSNAAEFLCIPDCVAEGEGFAPLRMESRDKFYQRRELRDRLRRVCVVMLSCFRFLPSITARSWLAARRYPCEIASVYRHAMRNRYTAFMNSYLHRSCCLVFLVLFLLAVYPFAQEASSGTQLPNGKVLPEVPGHPRQFNNLPTAAAISPDGRFAVFLHSGYGAYTSGRKQSLSVLNLENDDLTDYPDDRLASDARQTYFVGLVFSLDGKHLFASMASLTDPLGTGRLLTHLLHHFLFHFLRRGFSLVRGSDATVKAGLERG